MLSSVVNSSLTYPKQSLLQKAYFIYIYIKDTLIIALLRFCSCDYLPTKKGDG